MMTVSLARAGVGLCLFLGALGAGGGAQAPPANLEDRERWSIVGDQPDVAPPPAKLSPKLKKADIETAMRKVADWELARVAGRYNTDWTMGAMYTGFMAASEAMGDPKYREAMKAMGVKLQWKLGPRFNHADDTVVGQTYLELYLRDQDPVMIRDVREQFDRAISVPPDPANLVWWWCDALFMAPPAWARLYKITGNRANLDHLDREWWTTSVKLYDPQEHLYSRDASYLEKKEVNGRKVFWSRGNGWVFAGLVRVLQYMPEDYPDRGRFVTQFKEMAAKIASIQGKDGLWRPGLLNAEAYPLPETSGSAFFVYGLAWGVNQGVLDRSTYRPLAAKGWKGLLGHVYTDGRLGCVQPIGAAPGQYKATSSQVFGVGAFLLAGSELERMAGAKKAKK
jgi:unsaturated rhamnogalacturonyl hydrolase